MKLTRRLVGIAVVAVLSMPARSSGQTGSVRPFDVQPTRGIRACALRDTPRSDAWTAVFASRALDRDSARTVLATIQDSLAVEAAARPADVDVQYLLAVVIGARTDIEEVRTRIRLAEALRDQAGRVLALDPGHPGAHHLLGRLHAAVLRMDGFSRFIATRILGGGDLAGASWEEARLRLEAAVVGDPCVPDHHYELARLYAERGEPALAVERLHDLLVLADGEGLYADVFRKGQSLLLELGGGRSAARTP